MMIPLWLACSVAVAQAHAVVLVTGEAAHSAATEPAVDADDVAKAISVRVTGRDVDVLTVDDGTGERWTVSLTPVGATAVGVTIRAPDARVVQQGTVSFKRRNPTDVANTVAIWVIETLTPVMPELASERPEVVTEPLQTQLNELPPAPPRRSRDYFAVRVGVGGQMLPGPSKTLGQLEVGALWLATRSFALLVNADVSTSFSASDAGAHANVRRGGLVLAGEWRWRLAPVTLHAHAGPMLRGLRIAASGDVEFTHRTYVDPGAQVGFGVSLPITSAIDVGAALRGEYYFAHPAFTVDGKAALDTGSAAAGLVVWIEPHF